MISVPNVDISADTKALRSLRGPEYTEAVAKLIEKHGGACNEHGVFLDPDIVTIAQVGRAKAQVKLAQASDGLWFTGYDYCYSTGEGGGGPASVCALRAYHTREDALRAVSEWFADKFRSLVANERTGYCEAARTSARQMLSVIEEEFNPEQFDLLASA